MTKKQADRNQIAENTDLAAFLRAYCVEDPPQRFMLTDWGDGWAM